MDFSWHKSLAKDASADFIAILQNLNEFVHILRVIFIEYQP